MSAMHAAAPERDPDRRPHHSVARTHVGKVRLLNEDRYLDAPERGLWAIADGMGGHDAGDVAATMTVRALAALCDAAGPIDLGAIGGALQAVNSGIRSHMRQRGQHGGCTVAGLWLDEGRAHIFWAGDSRVYRFRNDRLERLTHDHSLVQQLLDAGALNADQAARHPQANVITRALGVDDAVEVELCTLDLGSGDRFLLCSDGVTAELSDGQLAGYMREAPGEEMNAIMGAALEAGGRDNLTLIMVG
ncbi:MULTISPECIES: PP2C family protein-serine/threonine phosphatase [Sphingobium]|uniref:PP2C family protein-serine/threonine phosphatase n=1 Tax=Sphingobium tyrosinilyticum TaxID=2715436 RepID=A0ABV9EYE4_9SPHN|nr:protein phosphatase 2C domain-containing protein [Sphingobium sp. EP60837]ANI79604.1 Protein-serine/threonine phosphatase [Sphingobium sp. EP60837]